MRDEGNYIGPTINRTARLRDLGHGGQTLLSGATESMVDRPSPRRRVAERPRPHPLRDLPRPERVVQLCHPDIRNDFPPLRTSESVTVAASSGAADELRRARAQIAEVRGLLADDRLVTLTGAGGAGKTRLAIEVAARVRVPMTSGTSTSRRSPTPSWYPSRWLARSGFRISRAARRLTP